MSFAEWSNKKKKKEEEEKKSTTSSTSFENSFEQWSNDKLGVKDEYFEYRKKLSAEKAKDDDIAPVAKKEEKRTWFDTGAFDDGYQFGDVTKTILGTVGDIGENIATGVAGMGEKALDAFMFVAPYVAQGQYYQNGGGFNIQADQAFNSAMAVQKEASKEFIKKDLYDEEKLVKGVSQKILGVDVDDFSVLGEKSDSLVQSGGQLLATAGLQAVGVPWFVTSGLTSYGSEVEGALNTGASYEEAGLSAAVTAGAEILTEKISGGIKFGGKALDDALTKEIARGISNKTVRTLAKLGLDMTGEGAEEVLSGVMSAIGQKLTYADDKELEELFSSEEALESFIGGAVLGGVSSGINAVKSNVKGIDPVSELTANEQKVVDRVYNDRVAEAEKNGKVSQKKKSEIYDSVLRDLEKGYISTDTIEDILGDKSSYDALSQEAEEFKTLYETEGGKLSEKQRDRLAELKEKNKVNPYETALKESKDQFSQSVFELVKSDRLAESYNEKGRRGQVYQADLTQYDAKQQAVVQKAIDSGVLNNTNRTHELVDMIAKISADKGVLFDFTNNEKIKGTQFAVEGKIVNGYVTDSGITLNVESPKYLESTVGHEITHVLEGTELYSALQQTIFDYAKSKGEYDSRLADLTNMYKDIKDANVEAELTADLVGDYLFQDSNFIHRLSTENRNVFQKIYDEIKYLCKIVTAGSKEARELEKVKKAFEDAYRANGNAKSGTKHSLSDGNIKDISTGYASGETYFTMSYSQDGKVVATLEYGEYDGKPNVKMIEVEPEYRRKGIATKLLQELQNKYPDTEIDFGMTTPDGSKLLDSITYDVTDEAVVADRQKLKDLHSELNELQGKLDVLYDTENLTEEQDAELHRLGDRWQEVYETIHELAKELKGKKATRTFVKTDAKYSLSDTNGNELTEEQREYFKDSKVRDETGNLKVMYHGTSRGGFNVFDTYKSKYGLFGTGFYFTDSENIGKSYTKKGKGNNPQVYEAYLNIKNPLDMDAQANPAEWAEAFDEVDFPESGTNEDFYRALEEYYEDQMIAKWEVEDIIRESIEYGMGYDGITHIGGGRVNPDGERHQVYIAFQPEQIKRIDNVKPTDNPDIRYSLSDSDGKQLTKEQQEYFKDSKMRDENGNLKVMYHGSQDAGFHTFESRFSDDDTSFFFIDSNEGAETYSGSSEVYEARTIRTVEDMNNFLAEMGEEDYRVTEENGKFTLYQENEKVADSDSAQGIYEEYCDWVGVGYGDANYKVYLNLKNPLEVDAQGRNWNRISGEFSQEIYDRIQSLTADEKDALTQLAAWEDSSIFRDELLTAVESVERRASYVDDYTRNLASAAEKLGDADMYRLFDIATDNFSEESLRENAVKYLKTRDYAQRAKEQGYDGVIFRNIHDYGVYADGTEGASTVAIAFDSNQIKSVANTQPTGDADIRYSLSDKDYLDAVNRGDKKTAQRMVEDAAIRAGYTTFAYHGTYADFFTFDKERVGKGTDQYGAGFYFASDKDAAGHYGSRVIDSALKLKNPFIISSVNLLDAEITFTEEQAYEIVKRHPMIYDPEESPLGDYYDSYWEDGPEEWMIEDLANQYTDLGYLDSDLFRDYPNELHEAVRDVTGHDGIVVNLSNGEKFYIAWFDNQMKSTDPITYDGSGNVIPLSGRFDASKNDIRYSLSGINAKTANGSMLLRAEHMLNAGADSETVRKETGWFKGYDGKMRFEIDDSKSQLIENPVLEKHENDGTTYFTGKLSDILSHDDLYEAYPQLRNVNIIIQETEPGTRGIYQPNSNYLTLSLELFKRHTKEYEAYLNGGRKAEIERIEQTPEYKEYNKWYEDEELSEKLSPEKWLEEEAKARDKFFNSDLGKRYYQLKWGKVNIQKSEFGWGKEAKEVLMHEIQHAIQKIENFARGSNPGYWRRVLASGDTIQTAEQKAELREAENKLYEIYKQNPEFYTEMTELLSTAPDMPRGKVDWDTLEQIEEDPIEWQEFDKKRDALEEKYGSLEVFDFFDLYHDVERYRKRSLDADDAYYSTAGEIEARDTANRLNLTAEERRNKRPDIDKKRVVFTDRYSLSEIGEQPRRYGDRATLGKDVAYAPVQKDAENATVSEKESVAPVVISKNETTTNAAQNASPNASPVLPNATVAENARVTPEEMQAMFPDDLAPAQTELDNLVQQKEALEARMLEMGNTEDFTDFEQVNSEYISVTERIAELENDEADRVGSLRDADIPPEMEAPYPGESNEVEDPFEDRDWYKVGNPKVKAYMYENPEVKPFFQAEAMNLLGELNDGQPAERWYNDQVYYESGGEKGFGGQKRFASADISELLDSWGMRYDDIRKGLNAIIEDNGAENIAAAKKIEFMLNRRLLHGYKDFYSNGYIEANQDYINLLEEKQITEYSEEAFAKFMETADQYAPAEDIAPVKAPTAVSPYDSMGAAPYGFDPITQLQYEYGNLPDGEHPVREDSMPKSTNGKDRVSLTARTVKGAGATPDEFVDLLDKETVGGRFSYIPIKNSATVQKAYNEIVKKGWEAARGEWETKVRRGEVSAELTATGSLLLNHAAKAGDRTAWLSVLHDYQVMGTNAGQAVQAMRILKTLTPDDSLYMIERSVEQMVEDMKLGTEIVIDDNLKQNYLNAKTDGERDAARKALAENVAKQIPSTAMDKWTALRYLNMLGNLRTQGRNILGNLGMSVTSRVKNTVATGIEWLAEKASGGKFHRTKSLFVGRKLLNAAKNDFANVKSVALNGGKFNDPMARSQQFQQEVQDARKIFKFAPLEGYRRATNWAMDTGDLVFSKAGYGRALAGYLKANGIKETDFSKIDQQTLDKARAYAIEQAQEQTFRDNNWLSSWVSRVGRRKDTPKVGKLISEGVMPFRKTPANILLRAEEYSPLGIVNATVKSIQAAKGNVTGADVVNSWAKALTGTGLFALGMWLNNSGMLSGGPDEDDDKEWFEDQYGWQNYAIQIGDNNYTIDFLSPAAMPLLMGAQLNELRQNSGVELKDLEKALLSIADPMIEMSMLQGLNDTLDNIRYAESNMGQFLVNACVSYLTQGLTNSFLGQLERSFEGQRMSTYTDKDSDLPAWLQKALGKASAKTPGWDYNQIPYIDAWGETEDIAPLPGLAENALSPSYISQGITDSVYEELNRLNDAQSDINVYPQTPDKTVTFDDAYGTRHENYHLSAEEYVELAQMQGQKQKEMVEKILSSRLYSGLTDQEKARAVQLAYQYAKEYSRQEVLGADGFSAQWMEKAGKDIVNAIIHHTNDEMTFAYEYPEKYQFFTENGISWNDYDSADENKKREYSNMYTWVSNEDHPGRYSLSKTVAGDFRTFWQFKNEITDIKDNNDSDSGTTDKELVREYIFNLDLDYGQQIILYRSLYESKQDKEDYNWDIIDYLNGRDDVSYEDMEAILKELGFTVSSDGTITWD